MIGRIRQCKSTAVYRTTLTLALGRAYTHRQNRCRWRRQYRCCHQYNRPGVHTYRQNHYRRLQGGQFREWCRAVNMAPMWNRRFCLLCLLHLRLRRRLKQRERECWEHPIVAARTLEGAYYTPYGRLRKDERKFINYLKMSTSTFDYNVDRLAPHLERQNAMMRESICQRQMLAVTLR